MSSKLKPLWVRATEVSETQLSEEDAQALIKELAEFGKILQEGRWRGHEHRAPWDRPMPNDTPWDDLEP